MLRPRKNAEWSGDGWIEREREREREMSLSAMENVTKCFKCLAKRDATNGRGTREKRRGCFDYISAEEFVRPSFPFREYVLFVFRNYSFFFFFESVSIDDFEKIGEIIVGRWRARFNYLLFTV